ncbi:ATP-binding protein [Streptomyces sp. NBC_00178]|uniref:ATP-binding protein n=1 Tax=Streptomyces sp. NBC_00178 TaxID=2975672 RepID=UPI003FA705EB
MNETIQFPLLRERFDSGGGEPAEREPCGESGRGLLIVEAAADRWGVRERDPGKVVWCAFARGDCGRGDTRPGAAPPAVLCTGSGSVST